MSGRMYAPTRYARAAMVSSIDATATAAGVELLRRGGSAVDAAIGANAVLAVVAPQLCGMGGDLWALVHDGSGGPPACLDASGFAGSGASAARVRAQGHARIPLRGHIVSVTVPGAVDGWLALHDRFGRLELGVVLDAAVMAAEDGFAASASLAAAAPRVADVAHNTDIPGDLRPGTVVRRPGSARSLTAIAERGRDGFYDGEFGEALLALGEAANPDGTPEYRDDDLRRPIARWVDPLRIEALGRLLWTSPPSSQGYLTLAGAWIADGLALPPTDDGDWAHLLVEAASQAAFDRHQVLHDLADGQVLLDPARLAPRRAAIDPDQASDVAAPVGAGDTTYLCAVDSAGMAVSLINSNASGFGAHLVAGSTGIFLHDRGIGFSLVEGHCAQYAPGRRPPHTLSPALVTRTDGSLAQVLGTMGGDAQPQILLQLLTRLLQLGQSPGAAVSAPRWTLGPVGDDAGFSTWLPGTTRQVRVEDPATGWHTALAAKGHNVTVAAGDPSSFGHAHIVAVTEHGTLAGAADPRALTGAAFGH